MTAAPSALPGRRGGAECDWDRLVSPPGRATLCGEGTASLALRPAQRPVPLYIATQRSRPAGHAEHCWPSRLRRADEGDSPSRQLFCPQLILTKSFLTARQSRLPATSNPHILLFRQH